MLRTRSLVIALTLLSAPAALEACGGSSSSPNGPPNGRITGQTSFVSAPPAGFSRGNSFGGAGDAAGGASNAGPGAPPKAAGTPQRKVEETDLYRLEGNRLYYLNAYRGLMVFDVTDVDHPKLLGRSPIFGSPVEMLVRNGIAVVVVADWYGALDDGSPFHGSIVRGLDATDPSNIKVLGDAKLGGWTRDLRVVGDVLYAVSEQWGEPTYGWAASGVGAGGGVASSGGVSVSPGGSTGSRVIVSSVSFAGGKITAVGQKSFDGYGGIFNVTPNSILLAHDGTQLGPYNVPMSTALEYLDITDPGGNIVERGSIEVHGRAQGWGADNGRWNLDFADGQLAHVVGCASGQYGCGGTNGSYVLATADFTSPDQPKIRSELSIPATGWSIAARFDKNRMYLVPGDYWYSGQQQNTPFQVFDLTNPDAPKLAGSAQIPGNVWIMIPSGNRLFALGNDYSSQSNSVSLKYLDVTNPASPQLIGTSAFGDGWAWTPAASTFKAFTKDDTQGLVVLPFSGWSSQFQKYNDGVQLIEFTPSSITTSGAANTRGWVERGIFVKNRLVSLSDLSLSVVDYSNHAAPKVVNELTLARNIVAAKPQGGTVAEVSSDWWGNDTTHSDVRVLPMANADESHDEPGALDLQIDGVGARVFRNGDLAYIVTHVPASGPCGNGPNGPQTCNGFQEQVQVVDLSNGTARLRGKILLPFDPYGYYGWGYGPYGGADSAPGYGGYYGGFWGGCYWYDWYDGAEAVQVGSDMLAFRRWSPVYDKNGNYVDASQSLFVLDLSNADVPQLASTVVVQDPHAWWGNLTAVGNQLYASHYEWEPNPSADGGFDYSNGTVRYYLDRFDLSDRAHPRIGLKINVPGILVGGSQNDPTLLYTIDYRWDGNGKEHNDFDVVKLDGGLAYLQSVTRIDGWVGNVFVRGDTAWTSAQQYDWEATNNQSTVQLHQLDLRDPAHPIDRVATEGGWGWLLGVEGDRAILTSGWGDQGVDIYRLAPSAAPKFDRFVRTRGWSIHSLARQSNQLFLASGYWGVQVVEL